MKTREPKAPPAGDPPPPEAAKDEVPISDKGTLVIEKVAIEEYWDERLKKLQDRIDEELWMARAVGGKPGERSLLWIELVDKAESTYVELRCAVVDTRAAPKVIIEATRTLQGLKERIGSMKYPRAVLGMIQACLHEQDLGFHKVPGSLWNFTEENVDPLYLAALQGIEIDPNEVKEIVKVKEGVT